MATFLSDLWTSVFTPGTTPTLLIATNATFAALQLTLFALLIGTYSIHFIVLSILCAGLWWSINWFAAEVALARQAEEDKAGQPRAAEQDQTSRRGDRKDTGSDEMVSGREVRPKVSAAELRKSGNGTEGPRRRNMADSEVSTDSEWVKLDGGSS